MADAGGPEILVHSVRNWIAQNKGREDMILLQKDINDAFNMDLSSVFLEECRQYAPAAWSYGSASHLIYEGSTYAKSRGQQGCPMMMALFCLALKRYVEEAATATGITLPFQPEYADDGFYGGRVQDVIRYFREAIRLAEKIDLKYDLSQCTVYLLSGDQFRGDGSSFQELGVQIRTGNDIQMLKSPGSGQQIFMNEFYDIRKEEFELSFRAVEELQNKYVTFHLLQQYMGFCQLQYLARTAPRQFLGPLLEWHDKRYRQSFETIIGRILPEQSWRQAILPPKLGDLGLEIENIPIGESRCYRADISYLIASRFIQDVRQSLIPPLPHHSILGWAVAIERLQSLFPSWQTDFQNSQTKLRQKEMASQTEDASHRDFQGILIPQDQLRLRYSTGCWADEWIRCAPSHAFDNHISNVVFSDSISMRFDLPLFDADEACLRSPQISDRYGRHYLNYIMIGKIGLHNCIRDEICRFLSGGGLGLKIEPLGLLPDESDRRPVDLLTIPSALCRQSSWHFLPRIAIDFAVISPFRMARGYLVTEDHITSKWLNRAAHTRCREQGIGFEPIVFDHAGGMNEEDKRILDSLSKAIDGPNGRQAGYTRYNEMHIIGIIASYIDERVLKEISILYPWDSLLIDSPP